MVFMSIEQDWVNSGEKDSGGQATIADVCCDVVFEKDWDAVQGSARAFLLSLYVKCSGLNQYTRVRFNDCSQLRSFQVNFIDPREVCLGFRR